MLEFCPNCGYQFKPQSLQRKENGTVNVLDCQSCQESYEIRSLGPIVKRPEFPTKCLGSFRVRVVHSGAETTAGLWQDAEGVRLWYLENNWYAYHILDRIGG